LATTYEEVIIAAHGYSSKSRPDQIATRSTELLAMANRAVRGLFAVAARVNPEYWGTSAVVAHDGAGWPRPENAQTVIAVQRTSTGAEVAVVPLDDLEAEQSLASVYLLGRKYRIAGSPLGPIAADNLTIYYSRLPSKPSNLSDVIDAEWEETFDNFLAIEVAIYLARKDGRLDEVQDLRPDEQKEAQLFMDFMAHATPITSYRFGQPRRVALPSIMPLLAGGGEGGGG
jgi:hypothetical protein